MQAFPCPFAQGLGSAVGDMLGLTLMLLLQFLMAGWLTGYTWRCDPVDFSQDPKALRVSSSPSPDKQAWPLVLLFRQQGHSYLPLLRQRTYSPLLLVSPQGYCMKTLGHWPCSG